MATREQIKRAQLIRTIQTKKDGLTLKMQELRKQHAAVSDQLKRERVKSKKKKAGE